MICYLECGEVYSVWTLRTDPEPLTLEVEVDDDFKARYDRVTAEYQKLQEDLEALETLSPYRKIVPYLGEKKNL
ncbi:MAG TPA: hypothetical protein VK604_27245 [Bryobacteraceae bacterium]|nr:hypothetical protein [Bryobacteraceae bacterium]